MIERIAPAFAVAGSVTGRLVKLITMAVKKRFMLFMRQENVAFSSHPARHQIIEVTVARPWWCISDCRLVTCR
jgi:hypothetical protein